MERTDLFLCHSSVDKEFARQLGAAVEAEEWTGGKLSVFLDEWDVAVGENIVLKINDALGHARFVGVLLSPEMIASDWCRAELSTTLYQDPTNRTARLIPMRVRDHHKDTGVPIEIPALLGPLNYLDFRRKDDFTRNLARLLATLRGEAPPRGGPRGGASSSGGGGIVPALPAREDPDEVPESLLSNLLSVTRTPSTIFSAPSKIAMKRELERGIHYPPFILKEGHLLSFHDPFRGGGPLSLIVSGTTALRVPIVEWRSNADRWRWVIDLLNETLRDYLGGHGVRFEREHHRYYFVPTKHQETAKQSRYVRWGAGTKRWLVRAPDEGKGGSWVHHGAELRFHDFAGRLYLSIDPSFLFTTDGRTPVPGEIARSLAMQWTARERNAAVLARVLLWADAIARGHTHASIPTDGGELAFARLPITGRAPVSIHDRVGVRALLTFADATLASPDEQHVTFSELPNGSQAEESDGVL